MRHLKIFLTAVTVLLLAHSAFAQRSKAGWAMGVNFGLANASQDDMDSVIEAGGQASDMGNGLEFGGSFGYNFGSLEILLRPSYYTVSEDGGSSEYELSAFSIFPTMRFHLLSNKTIKFYSQLGLGYSMVSGAIKEGSNEVDFSGDALGYSAGLGSEFCFIASHCFYLEANLRILGVDRMSVDKSSGTPTSNSVITQAGEGQEFEISGRDFGASLSGIQGVIGYSFHF